MSDRSLTKYRWMRVVALAVAYPLPLFLSMMSGYGADEYSVLDLFYPSMRRVLVLLALGVQLFRIFRPDDAGKARTVVLSGSTIGHEISLTLLSFALMGALHSGSWPGIPIDFLPSFYTAVDLLCVALLVGWRRTTVIDGDSQTVRQFHALPKLLKFSELKGLGMFETRFMRNGRHTGSRFSVAIFPATGKPILVEDIGSAAQVAQRITQLSAATGLPIARQ